MEATIYQDYQKMKTPKFIKKICKVRRQLNQFGQSRKMVDEWEITRVENVAAWDVETRDRWLKEHSDLVKKVCPQRFYKELSEIYYNLYKTKINQ